MHLRTGVDPEEVEKLDAHYEKMDWQAMAYEDDIDAELEFQMCVSRYEEAERRQRERHMDDYGPRD